MNWFTKWLKGPPVAPEPPSPTPQNVSFKGLPLNINSPTGSHERTMRCLCRMKRLYANLERNAHKGKDHLAPVHDELARLQASLVAAGHTGIFNARSIQSRIDDLEREG